MIWIDLLLLVLITIHLSISWSHKRRIELLEEDARRRRAQ